MVESDIVKKLRPPITKLNKPVNFVPFNESTMDSSSTQAAHFLFELPVTKNGRPANTYFVIRAVIVDKCSGGLLIGANLIAKHKMIRDTDSTSVTLYRGKDQVHATAVPWSEIEEHFSANTATVPKQNNQDITVPKENNQDIPKPDPIPFNPANIEQSETVHSSVATLKKIKQPPKPSNTKDTPADSSTEQIPPTTSSTKQALPTLPTKNTTPEEQNQHPVAIDTTNNLEATSSSSWEKTEQSAKTRTHGIMTRYKSTKDSPVMPTCLNTDAESDYESNDDDNQPFPDNQPTQSTKHDQSQYTDKTKEPTEQANPDSKKTRFAIQREETIFELLNKNNFDQAEQHATQNTFTAHFDNKEGLDIQRVLKATDATSIQALNQPNPFIVPATPHMTSKLRTIIRNCPFALLEQCRTLSKQSNHESQLQPYELLQGLLYLTGLLDMRELPQMKELRTIVIEKKPIPPVLDPSIEVISTLLRHRLIALETPDDGTPINQKTNLDEVLSALSQAQLDEYNKAQSEISDFLKTKCTNLQPELRPEAFPIEYWPYVMDSEKLKCSEEYQQYEPTYLATVIDSILHMDICTEKIRHKLEEKLFRALCLARVRTFAHIDKENPPNIKGYTMEIKLHDHTPSRAKPRPLSMIQRAFLKWRIADLKSKKKLRDSKSSWNSPPVLISYPARISKFLEKHGDEAAVKMWQEEYAPEVRTFYRLTNDSRELNSKTIPDRYPMPRIPPLLDRIEDCDRISSGDIEDAFFSMALAEQCWHLTAFQTPDDSVEYTVASQGLKNAAVEFSRVVSMVFSVLLIYKFLFYQDDILVYANPLWEHIETLIRVFDKCEEYRMTLKIAKTHLNYSSQKILGHIVSKNGRMVDPSLVQDIMKLQPPKTLQEVQSLLGLIQVARDYIPNLTQVIEPIQELTKGKKKGTDRVNWIDKIHTPCMNRLKYIMTHAPVLIPANPQRKFVVEVDTSKTGHGIGAILLQEKVPNSGCFHPVAYWTRALSDSERKYSATALEALGLHDALLHWSYYLKNGIHFEVIVDHYALISMILKMNGDATGRLLRMCLDLQEFNFTVTHRPGSKHLCADAVSRLLQMDETPYLRNAVDLRDDFGPLTETEVKFIREKYIQDCEFILATINDFRARRAIEQGIIQTDYDLHNIKRVENNAQILNNQNETEIPVTTPGSTNDCQEIETTPRPTDDCQEKEMEETTTGHQDYHEDDDKESQDPIIIQTLSAVPIRPEEDNSLQNNAVKQTNSDLEIHNIVKYAIRVIHEDSDVYWPIYYILTDGFQQEYSPDQIHNYLDYGITIPFIPQATTNEDLINRLRSINSSQTLTSYTTLHRVRQEAAHALQHSALALNHSIRLLDEMKPHWSQEYPLQQLTMIPMIARSNNLENIITNRKAAELKSIPTKHNNPNICTSSSKIMAAPSLTTAQLRASEEQNRNADAREERMILRTESNREKFEKWNYLTTKLYNDPISDQLYEIIGTHKSKITKKYETIARPIDASENGILTNDQLHHLPIEMACRLTEEYDHVIHGNTTWPQSAEQWVQLQQQDDFTYSLILLLDNSEIIIPKGRGSAYDCVINLKESTSTDYYFRYSMDDGKLGPIMRSHIRKTESATTKCKTTIEKEIIQTVLPQSLSHLCIRMHHDQLGHPGRVRTANTINLRYYWPAMHGDVKTYVQACHYCSCRKADNKSAIPPIQKYDHSPHPFYRTHMDLTGPFQETKAGNKYVLIFKDSLTKWIEIFALPDKQASTVATCFTDEIIARHGAPAIVITDRGTEFLGCIKQLCKLLNIKHKKTTAQNPRSDGLAENQMRTFKDMLTIHINKHHTNWDEHLATVAGQYRATVNDATGYTPNFLLYGREVSWPNEEHVTDFVIDKNVHTYAQGLRDVLATHWTNVAERVVTNVDRMNTPPRERLPFVPYKIGDFFYYIRVPRRFYKDIDNEKYKLSTKLQFRYTGPYQIRRVISPVTYEADINGHPVVVHAINMKRR